MSKSFWNYAAAAVYTYLTWDVYGASNFLVTASLVAGGADRGGYDERAAAKRDLLRRKHARACAARPASEVTA